MLLRTFVFAYAVDFASAYHAASPSAMPEYPSSRHKHQSAMAAPYSDTAKVSIRTRFREMAKISHPDAGGDATEFARMANVMHDEMALAKKEHELVISSIAVAGGAFMVGHLKALVGIGIGAVSAAACAATLLGDDSATASTTLEPAAPFLLSDDTDSKAEVGLLLLPRWLRRTVAKHGRESIRAFVRARKAAALALARGQQRRRKLLQSGVRKP